jgi:hypothetical protein
MFAKQFFLWQRWWSITFGSSNTAAAIAARYKEKQCPRTHASAVTWAIGKEGYGIRQGGSLKIAYYAAVHLIPAK